MARLRGDTPERELDARFSPPGQQPILQRLESFGRTRGLVFGAYGEASADVHDLLRLAARAQAELLWRESGARSVDEMYAVLVSRARRRVGLSTVQAMARHRLARAWYVGVSQATVRARTRGREQGGESGEWVYDAQDVFGYLARAQVGGGREAAAA